MDGIRKGVGEAPEQDAATSEVRELRAQILDLRAQLEAERAAYRLALDGEKVWREREERLERRVEEWQDRYFGLRSRTVRMLMRCERSLAVQAEEVERLADGLRAAALRAARMAAQDLERDEEALLDADADARRAAREDAELAHGEWREEPSPMPPPALGLLVGGGR